MSSVAEGCPGEGLHPLLEILVPFEATVIYIHGCGAESLAVTVWDGKRFRLWEGKRFRRWEFSSVSLDCDEKHISRVEIIRACFRFAIAAPIGLRWLRAIWQRVKQSVSDCRSIPSVLSLAALT